MNSLRPLIFLARGRSRPPTTLTDRFHLAQPQLRHWRQPRLRSSRPRRLLSSRRSHQDSGPQPIRRARTRRRRTSIEAHASRPRKSMASARNPACTKTSACFCQLSLVKRPPCVSTTPRSPLPYTSAETTPPSSVGNVMCSWARANTGRTRAEGSALRISIRHFNAIVSCCWPDPACRSELPPLTRAAAAPETWSI